MRALVLALAIGCGAVAVAAPATPGEQLYDAGARAFHKKQWVKARRAFSAAFELDRKVELLYDIALAAARQARDDGSAQTLREAGDAYRRYLVEAPNGRRRKQAEDALAAIDAQLAPAKPEAPPAVATTPPATPPAATPPAATREVAEPERLPLDPYTDAPASPVAAPAPAIVAATPAHPTPRADLTAPPYQPPARPRRWVVPVVVASALSVVALAVGLGVGLSQSSSGPSLGTVSWVP